MGRTKIVKMSFDLTDEDDALTYQRLAESARRAGRRGRGDQANYLISLMLRVRTYGGLQLTGLIERPEFCAEIDQPFEKLIARIKELAGLADKVSPEQISAPVLRLVPPSSQDIPGRSA